MRPVDDRCDSIFPTSGYEMKHPGWWVNNQEHCEIWSEIFADLKLHRVKRSGFGLQNPPVEE